MLKIRIYIILWLVIALFISISCNKNPEITVEQSQKFIKFFGGRGVDNATDIIECGAGFALTGTLLTQDSSMQAFFIVTDSLGNELSWSPVLFGGISNDAGNKIFRLQSGDFIIVGTKVISGNSADSSDIMVAKIGVNGIIKWIKTFGGAKKEEGLFGLETSSNDIVFGGYTESFGNGAKDICLYKINTEGDLLWSPTPTIGASSDDIGTDIIQMNNSLYILGTTQSYNIDGKKELFVVEADINNGKPLNMNHFGYTGGSLEGRKCIAIQGSELVILGQYVKDNTGLSNIYALQLNKNLYQSAWSKVIPADENEYVADILSTQNGILLYCTNVSPVNSNIKVYSLNFSGDVLDSDLLTNEGKHICRAALITSDLKTGIAGSSVYGNNSRVLLMKGDF